MSTIHTITNEAKRGCGYRRPGGKYIISTGLMEQCNKLPVPLKICPCCGGGIKPSLGWTWINPALLMKAGKCGEQCRGEVCGLFNPPEKAGLIWIGESFYKTPEDWIAEAHKQGISRKIAAIPRGFEVGKTWIFVAHRHVSFVDQEVSPDGKSVTIKDMQKAAAIFHAFIPHQIEYIVKGDETPEQLDDLEKRGFTLVKLVRTDGEENKMKWKRTKTADGQIIYKSNIEGYEIWSMDNGTLFDVVVPGEVSRGKVKSYEIAKQTAEEFEKARRLSEVSK